MASTTYFTLYLRAMARHVIYQWGEYFPIIETHGLNTLILRSTSRASVFMTCRNTGVIYFAPLAITETFAQRVETERLVDSCQYCCTAVDDAGRALVSSHPRRTAYGNGAMPTVNQRSDRCAGEES
jgi:hypothetical protein